MYGYYEPAVYEAISKLIGSPAIPTANRDMISYHLAADSFENRDAQKALTERLKILQGGAKPSPGQLEDLIGRIRLLPAEDELQARCDAATRTLEELAKDEKSPRLRNLKGVDERWYIVRVVEDSSQPLLAEKAAAVLFKERYLTVGSDAPDLAVTLIDDAPWRLADQLGKVVVVQFSFTGCGPCEQMYPDLAKLSKDYGDRVEILTLMKDKTSQNARDAVASGKLTWSVALDGEPGRVSTQWSVSGFPETYVIDRRGKIAARGLRGETLREKVIQLLDTDG
jgi:thiol-disulfide isomerase/thioredoxin